MLMDFLVMRACMITEMHKMYLMHLNSLCTYFDAFSACFIVPSPHGKGCKRGSSSNLGLDCSCRSISLLSANPLRMVCMMYTKVDGWSYT